MQIYIYIYMFFSVFICDKKGFLLVLLCSLLVLHILKNEFFLQFGQYSFLSPFETSL